MSNTALLDAETDEFSTNKETRIYVLLFEGKATDWPTWKEKYLARARSSKAGRKIFIDSSDLKLLDLDEYQDEDGNVPEDIQKEEVTTSNLFKVRAPSRRNSFCLRLSGCRARVFLEYRGFLPDSTSLTPCSPHLHVEASHSLSSRSSTKSIGTRTWHITER